MRCCIVKSIIRGYFIENEGNERKETESREREPQSHHVCVGVSTYREHLEDLQPVHRPTLLELVDGQRELDIPGILGEKQHQEDGPREQQNPVTGCGSAGQQEQLT